MIEYGTNIDRSLQGDITNVAEFGSNVVHINMHGIFKIQIQAKQFNRTRERETIYKHAVWNHLDISYVTTKLIEYTAIW